MFFTNVNFKIFYVKKPSCVKYVNFNKNHIISLKNEKKPYITFFNTSVCRARCLPEILRNITHDSHNITQHHTRFTIIVIS